MVFRPRTADEDQDALESTKHNTKLIGLAL